MVNCWAWELTLPRCEGGRPTEEVEPYGFAEVLPFCGGGGMEETLGARWPGAAGGGGEKAVDGGGEDKELR